MKKLLALLLAALLAGALVACGGGGRGPVDAVEGDGDPFGKYEQTVQLDLVTTADVTVTSQVLAYYPDESMADNRFTDLYADELNVKINYSWVAQSTEDYNTKLDMAMTIGNLPDAFIVDTAVLSDLVEAGQVRDLTEVWETYASPLLKEITEAEGDSVFKAASYDGKLYGIPQMFSSTDRAQLVWIRMDWLNKLNTLYPNLNLPAEPKTVDDMMQIISAFKTYSKDLSGREPNRAFGLSIQGDLWNSMGGITPMMNMYGAYPNIWLEKDGQLVYGSIQPEVKEPLRVLSEMYKNGQIAQDFATKSVTGVSDDMTRGMAGVVFGEQWLCSYPLQQVYDDDHAADWKAFPIFMNGETQNPVQVTMGTYGWWVVSNEYEHPEAIIKCMNTYVEHIWGSKADVEKYYMPADTGAPVWKLSPFQPEPPTKNLDCYLAIKEAQANGDDFASLTGEAATIYGNIRNFFDGNSSLWSWKVGYWPDGDKAVYESMNTYVEENRILYNAFSGAPTDTMRLNSQMDLFSAKQGEIFTAIINGTKDVDAGYNELVAYWNTMHGDQMTEEVNAWYIATSA